MRCEAHSRTCLGSYSEEYLWQVWTYRGRDKKTAILQRIFLNETGGLSIKNSLVIIVPQGPVDHESALEPNGISIWPTTVKCTSYTKILMNKPDLAPSKVPPVGWVNPSSKDYTLHCDDILQVLSFCFHYFAFWHKFYWTLVLSKRQFLRITPTFVTCLIAH